MLTCTLLISCCIRCFVAAVVDTSANYTGGGSEKMVGQVVDRWLASREDEGKAPSLTVVSKFGYASVSLLLYSVDQTASDALRVNKQPEQLPERSGRFHAWTTASLSVYARRRTKPAT